MRVFIINLEGAEQRRAHMLEQSAPYAGELDFNFFPAVNAHKGEHLRFSRRFSRLALLYKGRGLRPAQLGCFASHFSLWQKCLELAEPIVVLEDDVILKENFLRGLRDIATSSHSYVRLYCIVTPRLLRLKGNYALTFGKARGTQGYYLTPEAARKFLARAGRWFCPVDDYMDLFYYHDVPIITHQPFLLDEAGYPSQIAATGKRPILMVWLAEFCKIFRLFYKCIYLLFNKKRLSRM